MSDNLARGVSRHPAGHGPAADLGYDYHWGRIIGAALLLVLLIALLVYLLLHGFGDETVELPKNDSATSLTAEPTSAERRLPADPPLAAAPAVTEPERPADAETSSPDVPAASPESDVSTPSSSPEQAAERALPEPPPQPEVAADESRGAGDTAAISGPVRPPETSAPEPAPVTTNIAAATAVHAGLANFAVTTPSPSVARARFAASVRDNEPVGDPAAITANEQGLVRVIFFTEIRDRKGTPLVYRWLRDGKRVATVHTGAWNNAWRSYSSKFITPAQQGNWRVELVDDNGEVLAAGTFDYAR